MNNGVALKLQPCLVARPALFTQRRLGVALYQALYKTFTACKPKVVFQAFTMRRGEVGQLGRAQVHGEVAALGNGKRVL